MIAVKSKPILHKLFTIWGSQIEINLNKFPIFNNRQIKAPNRQVPIFDQKSSK